MNCYLKKIDENIGTLEYEMYQDIPKNEIGSSNELNGLSFLEFKKKIKEYLKYETIIDPKINATTKRYIFYVDDIPIGEIGIRTTLNDFWINKGSQIFYKVRKQYRNKGYGTKMLELALIECQKIGMKKVRINCDDNNEASKKVIQNNKGKIDIQSYKTDNGTSSSYIIELK